MERVRPGVELVFAILVPKSELITLDLPTFERPRNATSGSAGAGNWLALVAEVMNLERTRTTQCQISGGNLQVAEKEVREKQASVQAERPLVFDVFIGDRAIFVSQIKQPSNYDSNADTDREKHAVRRKGDQHRQHDHGGDRQAGGAFHVDGHAGKHGSTREIVVPERTIVERGTQ